MPRTQIDRLFGSLNSAPLDQRIWHEFLAARDKAGQDPELRYRAAFNLGMSYAKSADAVAEEGPQEAIDTLIAWVESGASPMCGNSICQDRRFLAREMPELERYFHYRNLDVSTLKILAQQWAPDVAAGFTKESSHRALSDIRDSIAELGWYRNQLFDQSVITPTGPA